MTSKFISPGAWFSIEYPVSWSEFEDSEDCFLFYNPNKWEGNFRISAFRGKSSNYAMQCIQHELKQNSTSVKVKIGDWDCAYWADTFQENGSWYTTHFWVTGKDAICVESSFTVHRGEDRSVAEAIIETLMIRNGKEPLEVIPIRLMEIVSVNEAYEWTSSIVKKNQNKDFTSQETDIPKLQMIVDGGKLPTDQRTSWENIALALGVIIENEMDGMQWVTIVDGKYEYPALRYHQTSLIVKPTQWIWNLVRNHQPICLKDEYERIKKEVMSLDE